MTEARLPKLAKPVRYEIFIHPNFEGFAFKGEETIELEVLKPTKQLILHSAELKITSVKVVHNKHEQTGRVSYNKKDETATFAFPRSIPTGQAKLYLGFTGELNDKMRGFYRSKFTHRGKEKYLATTQFEATDARRAFPCFDEPSQKAVFDLTLMVPKGMTAISNTIESEIKEHESGYSVVKFESTPKMSTYLLAFIVGEFEWVEGKTKDGCLVRVFTTPGKKHQAEFALDVAIKCLEFYNSYFVIPYPLPSMDLVAIPDFAAGAMENWGAVTYRESALLVDPEHTSTANKQWVAMVIAHELAHQWFGDLVTMEWWTHLWLNEGFASYIEHLAVDSIFPEWDIWTQFIYLEHSIALKLDSLKNTHPIEVEVHDPNEIAEVFDKISYSKGASILRMLAEYLGYEDFRDGLRHYLKRYAYSNAKTEDLWQALGEVSGKNVEQIMGNWTSKSGYPVIRVERKDSDLKLTQQRFLSSAERVNDATIWNVPVNVLRGKAVIKYLMNGKNLTISAPKEGRWIKLNHDDASFIRVSYPQDMLDVLESGISKMSTIDRLSIVRDVFDLSEPGYICTDQALKMALNYTDEEDYTVWTELVAHISQLSNLLYNEKFYPEFEAYCQKLFSKIAGKMGWAKKSEEKHTDSLLRSIVLYQLGTHGDKATIKKAQQLFSSLLQGKKVDTDIRGVVYNLVAENGGVKEYERILKMYKKEELQQEKERLGRALGSFKDEKLLKRTLEFALGPDVRLQDGWGLIIRVWMNPFGRELAWEFVKKNWDKLYERYAGGHHLARLVGAAAEFTDSKHARDFEDFFKKHKAPEAKRTVAQTIEQILSNEAWLKRDGEKVANLLNT